MGCTVSKNLGGLVRDAAMRGDVVELQELLRRHRAEASSPEDIRDVLSSTDNKGRTALIIAAKKSHLAVAEFLLEHGAEPNSLSTLGTALHVAAEYNNVAMLNVLASRGARLGIEDTRGKTPLDIALSKNFVQFVKECFQYCPFANYLKVERPRGLLPPRLVVHFVVALARESAGSSHRTLELLVLAGPGSARLLGRASLAGASSAVVYVAPARRRHALHAPLPALQVNLASERNAEGLKVRCGRNNRPHVLLREPYDDVAGQSLWALHAVLQSDARGTPAAAPWQRQEETVGVVIGTPVPPPRMLAQFEQDAPREFVERAMAGEESSAPAQEPATPQASAPPPLFPSALPSPFSPPAIACAPAGPSAPSNCCAVCTPGSPSPSAPATPAPLEGAGSTTTAAATVSPLSSSAGVPLEESPGREDSLCIVCQEQAADAGLLHNGTLHRVCCMSCAAQIQRAGRRDSACPVCRQRIEQVVRVYEA